MSGQLIELIIFAAIAFFIINKLLSTLGTTSENDPTKNKTFFGESGKMKDVTNTSGSSISKIVRPNFKKKKTIPLKGLIVVENEEDIKTGIVDVLNKLPSFDPANFLKGAQAAFKMILTANANDNDDELAELVDKRYIEDFKSMAASYGTYTANKTTLTAHISEIYLFGNNIFIKILFAGKNITDKVKEMHEEWTFTKSALNSSPEWHLTNIDRPQ
jgi:predicted lipid-binding transport protein (Tim44 family)